MEPISQCVCLELRVVVPGDPASSYLYLIYSYHRKHFSAAGKVDKFDFDADFLKVALGHAYKKSCI